MSFKLIQNQRLAIQSNFFKVYLVQLRSKHINHPGHKPKPIANPPNLTLSNEYLDEPNYPPIKPKYPPGKWKNDYETKLAWFYFEEGQKFHSLKTIQERLTILAYMNIQQTIDDLRREGTRYFPIYAVSALSKAAKISRFSQYITNTHVTFVKSLPDDKSDKLNQSIDKNLYEKLKNSVKTAILLEMSKEDNIVDKNEPPSHPDTYKPEVLKREKKLNEDISRSNSLIKSIFNSLTSILSLDESNKHLVNAQYGTNVNIKSYWKRCGFEEQNPRGNSNKDPGVIRFQFEDIASYQIKCDKPLNAKFKFSNPECSKQVEKYAFNPNTYKIHADHILPMQVPGHWYGDKREFNFLTVFNTTEQENYLNDKFQLDISSDDFDALKSMAVKTGHAELTAQAYYLGFSLWKDLTYPLFGQFVFTNGVKFSVGSYQLNTIRLWNDGSNLTNLCFISEPESLYKLNQEKTEVIEFNDKLFVKLLNALVEKPIKNDEVIFSNYSEIDYMIGGSRLRPYLSVNDLEKQLTMRHKLLATSLYELVKYDKPTSYLNLRNMSGSKYSRPKFPLLYNKYTFAFRDIVLDYYPQDYYGLNILKQVSKVNLMHKEKFWDRKHTVYEWANVPPAKSNSIPREIPIPTF